MGIHPVDINIYKNKDNGGDNNEEGENSCGIN